MARSRSKSRASKRKSKSKVRYTKTGLPYTSDVAKSDVGIVIEDKKGNLKQLHHNRGKFSWKAAQVKDLSTKREDYYYNQLENHLDDKDKIHDILEKVLQEVQPKVSKKY